MKAVKAKCKFAKENRQNPLNTISVVSFLQTRLFTEKFSRTGTIHPGIFRGRALWAVIIWLCPTRTENYQTHEFDWLK